jgi:Leucine-rich repeat (LRR) protein
MEPSSASTPPAPAAGPVDYAAERKAAEWVLSVGGHLQTIDEAGVIAALGPGGKLPDGQWQLKLVNSLDGKKVNSGDLERLASCRNLKILSVREANIGDAGCITIGRMTNLESLDLLGSSKITNAGIKSLVSLKKLRELGLTFIPISDDAIDAIAGMTELRTLHLGETQVTDVGFKKLATLIRLEELTPSPGVTDQGLSILGNFPQLKSLGLKGHQITDTSVAELQKLPKLINLSVVGATDENIVAMKRLTQLRHLGLNMGLLTEQGIQTLPEFKWLQDFGYTNAPGFDDAVLMRLSENSNLQFVFFDKSSSVSPKGIENFRAVRPDVLVTDGVQVYPATVPAKTEEK